MERLVIIGNSGSGKSYLAAQLAAGLAIPVTHLDELFWETGSFEIKRPKALVLQDIEAVKQQRQWIVEGVYGELVKCFLDQAEALIWLDMPWPYCHNNLLRRDKADSRETEESLQSLLQWASQYWTREDLRSHMGHKALYDDFQNTRLLLRSRAEVDALISNPSNLK